MKITKEMREADLVILRALEAIANMLPLEYRGCREDQQLQLSIKKLQEIRDKVIVEAN